MDVCEGFVKVSLLEGDRIVLRFNPYGGATYEWIILPDGRVAGEVSWWHDGTVTSDGCEGGGSENLGLPSRRFIDAILNHPIERPFRFEMTLAHNCYAGFSGDIPNFLSADSTLA